MSYPESMRCPQSHQFMYNPVLASNGITYERSALMNLYKGGDHITLLNGEEIENQFVEDKVMVKKVKKFLKENPCFIMPIPEESKKKFISAVTSNNFEEMELSLNKEPLLLSERLFGEKNVFQHLSKDDSDNIDKLCFLLKIAKTKQSPSEWHDFFEYLASKGRAFVIVSIIKNHILNVNDNSFSGKNTLLHLAAKYGRQKLIKQLILKCDADIYLKNGDNNKAEDIGLQQLIHETIQKKVFKQLYEKREKQLDKKIKGLEDQNAALKKDMDMMARRVTKIQDAHNNFVRTAHEKGFFNLPHLQSSFRVKRQIKQCSYSLDDFDLKDTYGTFFTGPEAPRYRMACCEVFEPLFTPDLSREREEQDYKKCIIEKS